MCYPIRLLVFTTIVPLSMFIGCTPPKLDPPSSLGSEIAARTGATPSWASGDAPTSPDAASLRRTASLALPPSLDESVAVAMALDANPELARMIAETEAMRADALESAAPQNPVVNFTSGIPLDSMSVVPIFAMLMVQIDDIWKQPMRSDAARDTYEAALLTLGARAVAIASEARSLWHEVAMREEECSYALNDLELTERLLAIARAQFSVGELDGDTVAKAQAETLDAHHRLEMATEARASARLEMMALVGRAEAEASWSVGASDAAAQFAVNAPLLDEARLLAHISSSRLDVRAAEARVRAAQSTLELAMRSRLNSVQIGGGYDRDMEGDEAAAFSANIEIPLFKDGSARIARAQAQYRTAAIEAERVRQSAIVALRTALVKAQSTEGRHAAERLNGVDPTVQIVARADAAVVAGEASQQMAIDAAHALNHAKLALTDLERERRRARIALTAAVGLLPSEVMP